MSFKRLFSRSLEAAPGRLHLAAHSHHLWPDASFDGQVEAWADAARLADRKWDKVMGEVWPEAQGHVAAELGSGRAESVVFASNTHDFLVRLAAAAPRPQGVLRILTSDGEFHSARRQFARWAEEGTVLLDIVPAEPFEDFAERFVTKASAGGADLLFVSQILFGSGRVFDRVEELAALARPEGPWVVVDGYHAFMAIERPLATHPLPPAGGEEARSAEGEGLSLSNVHDRPSPMSKIEPSPRRSDFAHPPAGGRGSKAFFLAGGYKYAMAGEGIGLLHAPPGFGERPPITGWFAEVEDLAAPPGAVGYRRDAMRFMGATFDPSALYRFNHVQRMLAREGLTTAVVSAHVATLQVQLLDQLAGTPLGTAELLNPLDEGPHARFLAFRSPQAQQWCAQLAERGCMTDVRGDVLRVGIGLYHDAPDIDAFAALARGLR